MWLKGRVYITFRIPFCLGHSCDHAAFKVCSTVDKCGWMSSTHAQYHLHDLHYINIHACAVVCTQSVLSQKTGTAVREPSWWWKLLWPLVSNPRGTATTDRRRGGGGSQAPLNQLLRVNGTRQPGTAARLGEGKPWFQSSATLQIPSNEYGFGIKPWGKSRSGAPKAVDSPTTTSLRQLLQPNWLQM